MFCSVRCRSSPISTAYFSFSQSRILDEHHNHAHHQHPSPPVPSETDKSSSSSPPPPTSSSATQRERGPSPSSSSSRPRKRQHHQQRRKLCHQKSFTRWEGEEDEEEAAAAAAVVVDKATLTSPQPLPHRSRQGNENRKEGGYEDKGAEKANEGVDDGDGVVDNGIIEGRSGDDEAEGWAAAEAVAPEREGEENERGIIRRRRKSGGGGGGEEEEARLTSAASKHNWAAEVGRGGKGGGGASEGASEEEEEEESPLSRRRKEEEEEGARDGRGKVGKRREEGTEESSQFSRQQEGEVGREDRRSSSLRGKSALADEDVSEKVENTGDFAKCGGGGGGEIEVGGDVRAREVLSPVVPPTSSFPCTNPPNDKVWRRRGGGRRRDDGEGQEEEEKERGNKRGRSELEPKCSLSSAYATARGSRADCCFNSSSSGEVSRPSSTTTRARAAPAGSGGGGAGAGAGAGGLSRGASSEGEEDASSASATTTSSNREAWRRSWGGGLSAKGGGGPCAGLKHPEARGKPSLNEEDEERYLEEQRRLLLLQSRQQGSVQDSETTADSLSFDLGDPASSLASPITGAPGTATAATVSSHHPHNLPPPSMPSPPLLRVTDVVPGAMEREELRDRLEQRLFPSGSSLACRLPRVLTLQRRRQPGMVKQWSMDETKSWFYANKRSSSVDRPNGPAQSDDKSASSGASPSGSGAPHHHPKMSASDRRRRFFQRKNTSSAPASSDSLDSSYCNNSSIDSGGGASVGTVGSSSTAGGGGGGGGAVSRALEEVMRASALFAWDSFDYPAAGGAVAAVVAPGAAGGGCDLPLHPPPPATLNLPGLQLQGGAGKEERKLHCCIGSSVEFALVTDGNLIDGPSRQFPPSQFFYISVRETEGSSPAQQSADIIG